MAAMLRQASAAPGATRRAAAAAPTRTPAAPVRRALVVRAQEAAAAPAAKPEAPKWTEPTLNPDTPSPIFGGSTGGLLRAAQVCV